MASQRLRIVLPALIRMGVLTVASLFAWQLFGAVAGLSLGLAGLLLLFLLHLHYLAVLGEWLERPSLATIPDGWGAWAEVFTRLYRTRRQSEFSERELVDNEARFRRMLSALPEGIVLIDDALQIDWCNPVAQQHLGVQLEDDRGLRITNLVRDPAFVAFMTSARFDEPLMLRPLASPTQVLAIRVIEFESGRSILLSRDVTQSERLDAMRRDFVANVSHELRTPLTVVKGFLETMLDAPGPQDPQRREHLRLMDEQAQRMARLVEDLLMLSKLEADDGQPADEPVDVAQLVQALADEARALSQGQHQIEVNCAADRLRGSAEELRSAFGNLVSNAIRYTPKGGRISLRWRVDADGGRFEVQDSGSGIAPEHLPRLTERFYRVDKSRSRETGGTGLGLAIVKHVMLRHQGELEVRSQLGAGSTFTLAFPRARLLLGPA